MSREEPNWSAFYQRLQRLGPRMLKGVPGEYKWWVEETAVGSDLFWPGTQDAFYTWWAWTTLPDHQRRAVGEALRLWAENVIREMAYMAEIWETEPRKLSARLRQIKKMRLEPDERHIDAMLAGALLPLDTVANDDNGDDDDADEIPVGYLPFELLPEDPGGFGNIASHLRARAARRAVGTAQPAIDESRLAGIRSLSPDKCYLGSEEWEGYVLFDFIDLEKAILECPVEGNAIYILSGDWREMVAHSKQYLREHHADRLERVFHQGDWLTRVRNALAQP